MKIIIDYFKWTRDKNGNETCEQIITRSSSAVVNEDDVCMCVGQVYDNEVLVE